MGRQANAEDSAAHRRHPHLLPTMSGQQLAGLAEESPPEIAISTGIIIALVASLVQSFGLTIQRKSHLQNEASPQSQRRRDWQRPLWLAGFAVFITSNVLGSVFQIGALPIVVLAPLGAVSLLWNAFFARFLLGDHFSRYLIIGTILIAGGAVLIAIFGVVKETTHTLDELLELYRRPGFIVWISIQFAAIALILGLAHYSEHSLESSLQDVYIALPTGEDDEDLEAGHQRKSTKLPHRIRKARRWSTPPAYLTIDTGLTDTANGTSDVNAPPLASPSARATSPTSALEPDTTTTVQRKKPSSRHVSFGVNDYGTNQTSPKQSGEYKPRGAGFTSSSTIRPRLPHDKAEKIRLWLGIAFGSASGTLSGLCLLFAKTGVELLILTVVGHNQFKRWESWMIVLALLVCALLQLWYLNKSLRLVGPTLICPLAFCFYNLSSIFNGLTYYNQWSMLTGLQDGLMCLGIGVLLAGVWIVSIKSTDEEVEEHDLVQVSDEDDEDADESDGLLRRQDGFDEDDEEAIRSPDEETFGDLKSRIANLYQAFLLDQAGPPRGFSVGIAASSPGFAIRPQHHQRRNTAHSVSGLSRSTRHSHSRSDDFTFSPAASTQRADTDDTVQSSEPLGRTTSEPAASTATATASTDKDRDVLSYRHRRKRSLAGDIYVGAPDPFSEEPAFEPPMSPRKRRSSSVGARSNEVSGNTTPTRPRFSGMPWAQQQQQ